VPLVLAALLPVVVYCSVRALAPARGESVDGSDGGGVAHRRHTDLWHVLMGAAMIAMLLGDLARPLAIAAVVVCAAGLCWGVLSLDRRTEAGGHLRFMVGAAAMAVMTLPVAAPAMAADGSGGSDAMSGMSSMSGIGPSPVPLVLVLLVGLLAVAVTRVPAVVRRSRGAVARLDAGCDVVMAGAMAAMLLALL
jgi:type IV secretory pathway VirB2 component (pilin)